MPKVQQGSSRGCRRRRRCLGCRRPPLPLLPQEVVEATAEEANRKLQLNLHDKVGAGGKAPPPSAAQLEAFGLTQEFADWVRTLNYRWVWRGGGCCVVLGARVKSTLQMTGLCSALH